MEEEIRQKLLEDYGIGVEKHVYPKDKNKTWFGIYQINGSDFETINCATRRQAEDKAIAEYETKTE